MRVGATDRRVHASLCCESTHDEPLDFHLSKQGLQLAFLKSVGVALLNNPVAFLGCNLRMKSSAGLPPGERAARWSTVLKVDHGDAASPGTRNNNIKALQEPFRVVKRHGQLGDSLHDVQHQQG